MYAAAAADYTRHKWLTLNYQIWIFCLVCESEVLEWVELVQYRFHDYFSCFLSRTSGVCERLCKNCKPNDPRKVKKGPHQNWAFVDFSTFQQEKIMKTNKAAVKVQRPPTKLQLIELQSIELQHTSYLEIRYYRQQLGFRFTPLPPP